MSDSSDHFDVELDYFLHFLLQTKVHLFVE
jgi:hypothetical protein